MCSFHLVEFGLKLPVLKYALDLYKYACNVLEGV